MDSAQEGTRMLRKGLTIISACIQFYYYYHLPCLPSLRQSYLLFMTSLETVKGWAGPRRLVQASGDSLAQEIWPCALLPLKKPGPTALSSLEKLLTVPKFKFILKLTARSQLSLHPASCLSIMSIAIAIKLSESRLLSTYYVPGNVKGVLCTMPLVFRPTSKVGTIGLTWWMRKKMAIVNHNPGLKSFRIKELGPGHSFAQLLTVQNA